MSPDNDEVPTLAKVAARLDRVVELMERVLVSAPHGATGTVQQVNLPTPQPQRTERLVLVMCVATAVMGMVAVGAIVAAILQGQRVTDMRADFGRDIDRLDRRQDMHAEWARTESGVLRGYIWTGKVPVANPYPKEATP